MPPHQWSLRYGTGTLTGQGPAGAAGSLVSPRFPPPDPGCVDRALREPLGTPPLSELARGCGSAAILVPGQTRVAGVRAYVPALVEALRAGGLSDRQVCVVLATGTHEQHSDADIVRLLGEDIVQRIDVVRHDCHDRQALRELGITSRGTPVLLNRRVLETDLVILTGRVVPHYFAGFGGGRKALIPGVAGFDTILANHRLTLDPGRGIPPSVRPCSLEGNPVHEDMLEAAAMAPAAFCLNTILDAEGRLVDALAGDYRAVHQEAGRRVAAFSQVRLKEPFDAVVACAGGAPNDCNFMQALKAVMNTRELVRPGGALLWVAACPGGIHPGFLEWAKVASDDELEEQVRANYNLTGHNSIMLRRIARRAHTALCSRLPAEVVSAMGYHRVTTLQEGFDWLGERLGKGSRYAVVPFANITCGTTG